MIVVGGSTDVTTYFAMRLLAGGDATGLTITDFDLQYVRSGVAPAAKADATALAATDSAHSDNKGIEIDATDQPGLYRFDWPDAAFAAGVREVILTIKHTSCFSEHLRVEIDPKVSLADGSITAAVIATDAIDADAIKADAVTEIQNGLATAAALDTVDNFLDTEIAAIKTQTDKLTFTVANQIDANIQYVNDVQVTGDGQAGTEWGP